MRTPWNEFPSVIIHSPESVVKGHPDYKAAKSGDAQAAFRLVKDTMSTAAVNAVGKMCQGKNVVLVSAHAVEREGVNAIPEALADLMADELGLTVDGNLVQTNIVGHTGASGFARLARPAVFDGPVERQTNYFLVDDFIGQGGTLANLKGHIETSGGYVVGATVLTGKPFSAMLALSQEQLNALREKHGKELESWWINQFGYGFDSLT